MLVKEMGRYVHRIPAPGSNHFRDYAADKIELCSI